MTRVTPLDDPIDGMFHYEIAVGDEIWKRGDKFFRLDHRGIPREYVFTHHNAVTGDTSCYRMDRYGPRGNTRAAGFVSMIPARTTEPGVSGDNLRFTQLLGDLRDIGGDELADELEGSWTGAPASVRAQLIQRAEAAITTDDDDEEEQLEDIEDVETDLL